MTANVSRLPAVAPSNRSGDRNRATGGIVMTSSHPIAAAVRDEYTAAPHAKIDEATNAAQVPAANDADSDP